MGVCVLAPAQAAVEPLTAPVWACDQQGVGVVPGVKTAALLPDPRPAPASPPGLPGALIRADEGGARPAALPSLRLTRGAAGGPRFFPDGQTACCFSSSFFLFPKLF